MDYDTIKQRRKLYNEKHREKRNTYLRKRQKVCGILFKAYKEGHIIITKPEIIEQIEMLFITD